MATKIEGKGGEGAKAEAGAKGAELKLKPELKPESEPELKLELKSEPELKLKPEPELM